MDFLIAGLIFLLIILYHFVEQRRLDLDNNRTFFCFLLFGMADLCFDLICSILIMQARPALAGVSEFCLVILYLLQVLGAVHAAALYPDAAGAPGRHPGVPRPGTAVGSSRRR